MLVKLNVWCCRIQKQAMTAMNLLATKMNKKKYIYMNRWTMFSILIKGCVCVKAMIYCYAQFEWKHNTIQYTCINAADTKRYIQIKHCIYIFIPISASNETNTFEYFFFHFKLVIFHTTFRILLILTVIHYVTCSLLFSIVHFQ